MSLRDCIQTAIDAGEMDAERGQAAQWYFDRYMERFANMGRNEAEGLAGVETKKILAQVIEEKRRRHTAVIRGQKRLDADLDGYRDRKGRNLQYKALTNLLKGDGTAEFISVDAMTKSLTSMLFRDLNEFVAKHSKGILGSTRNKADLGNVRAEVLGESTGDATSAAMGRALGDAFERARQMYNAAGGHIQKLENWAPQKWNRHGVRRISEDEFVADVGAEQDWSRVVDPLTNQPFGGFTREAREFLKAARRAIITDGWDRKEPSLRLGGKALMNRRADHRVLHFRDSASWDAVAQKYGSPDLFDASVSYLHSMARDIALMRALHPNPKAGLEFAIQKATRQAELAGQGDKARAAAGRARAMLAHLSGETSMPENEAVASFMTGVRDMLTAAHLGSAIVSSVTDVGTVTFASQFVGMGSSRVLNRAVRNLTSGRSKADMQRSIGVLETALQTSASLARFSNDVMGPEVTRRISSFVIRAQGLAHMTDIWRNSFRMEFMGFLAEHSGTAWEALPRPLQRELAQRGITPAKWAKVASAPRLEGETGTFLVPDLLRDLDEDLAIRLQAMIEENTDIAIPVRDVRGTAFFLGQSKPGTFSGELLRSGLMFKNWGVSLVLGQMMRVHAIDSTAGKIGYAATFISTMTVLGALAIQLKEAVKGRDPRPMDSAGFWGAAVAQGGGFGIFGDFFQSGTNRFGGGIAGTLAGPMAGAGQDVFNLTAQNVVDAIQGKDAHAGRDLTRFVRRYMPGGSLWYARLPLERLVFDRMQMALDPEAFQDFRRREKQRRRDYGNRSWWQQGDLAPERAPALP